MNICKRCKVNIVDNTLSCPLCNGVVEKVVGEDASSSSHSIMYPQNSQSTRKLRFAIKLVVFVSVALECLLVFLNSLTGFEIKWSLISGVALAYGCFSLSYSAQRNKSHRKKMMVQAVMIMPVLAIIDIALGSAGWSINYAIPGVIIAMDIAILVLMLVNSRNWQSYLLLQVWHLFICIILSIFMFEGLLFTSKLFIGIADAVTLLLLCGTVVFGGKQATTELKRRFHV